MALVWFYLKGLIVIYHFSGKQPPRERQVCPLRGRKAEARTASQSPSSVEVSVDGWGRWGGSRAWGEGKIRLTASVFKLNSYQKEEWGWLNVCLCGGGRCVSNYWHVRRQRLQEWRLGSWEDVDASTVENSKAAGI